MYNKLITIIELLNIKFNNIIANVRLKKSLSVLPFIELVNKMQKGKHTFKNNSFLTVSDNSVVFTDLKRNEIIQISYSNHNSDYHSNGISKAINKCWITKNNKRKLIYSAYIFSISNDRIKQTVKLQKLIVKELLSLVDFKKINHS